MHPGAHSGTSRKPSSYYPLNHGEKSGGEGRRHLTQERPFFVYSLRWSLYLNVIIGALGIIGAVYLGLTEYGLSAILTTPGLLFLAALWGSYIYSRKPLKKARFYDDHFELSGRNVNIRADYSSIVSLKEVKQYTGRSKQAVLFKVKDSPAEFRIPFRRKRGKSDLIAELSKKATPSTAS